MTTTSNVPDENMSVVMNPASIWIAQTPKSAASFVVHHALGSPTVTVNDQVAADIAVQCGSYQP